MANSSQSTTTVTQLLAEIRNGDSSASDRLMNLVYQELHSSAINFMAKERRGDHHTLQPTALVHEAFLRLMTKTDIAIPVNRKHFFYSANRAMRQILIEHQRARMKEKRGGKWNRLDADVLDSLSLSQSEHPWDLLLAEVHDRYGRSFGELCDVIDSLEKENKLAAMVVWFRFVGGMQFKQIAEIMEVEIKRVQLLWAIAKNWLTVRLGSVA